MCDTSPAIGDLRIKKMVELFAVVCTVFLFRMTFNQLEMLGKIKIDGKD